MRNPVKRLPRLPDKPPLLSGEHIGYREHPVLVARWEREKKRERAGREERP